MKFKCQKNEIFNSRLGDLHQYERFHIYRNCAKHGPLYLRFCKKRSLKLFVLRTYVFHYMHDIIYMYTIRHELHAKNIFQVSIFSSSVRKIGLCCRTLVRFPLASFTSRLTTKISVIPVVINYSSKFSSKDTVSVDEFEYILGIFFFSVVTKFS